MILQVVSVALWVTVCGFAGVRASPVVNATESDPRHPCWEYNYCEGTKFDKTFMVDERMISCDPYPDVRENCCMPHAKHMVCYSAAAYGQYFDLDFTDFKELCRLMLAEFDKVPSRHATAIVMDDAGSIGFRDGHIYNLELEGPSNQHIHNLACSYE